MEDTRTIVLTVWTSLAKDFAQVHSQEIVSYHDLGSEVYGWTLNKIRYIHCEAVNEVRKVKV